MRKKPESPLIGTLRERTIHSQLKTMYLSPGSRSEVRVHNYVVDVLHKDGTVVEIQTAGFQKIRAKLARLLESHRVRLVYPLPAEKELILVSPDTRELLSKRKSPKRNTFRQAGDELYWIAPLLSHPGIEVELLLTREQELRIKDGNGSWRRRGISIADRLLLEVVDRRLFQKPSDYCPIFLPEGLPGRFTNKILASVCRVPVPTAWRITSLLRAMNLITRITTSGREHVFSRVETGPAIDKIPTH